MDGGSQQTDNAADRSGADAAAAATATADPIGAMPADRPAGATEPTEATEHTGAKGSAGWDLGGRSSVDLNAPGWRIEKSDAWHQAATPPDAEPGQRHAYYPDRPAAPGYEGRSDTAMYRFDQAADLNVVTPTVTCVGPDGPGTVQRHYPQDDAETRAAARTVEQAASDRARTPQSPDDRTGQGMYFDALAEERAAVVDFVCATGTRNAHTADDPGHFAGEKGGDVVLHTNDAALPEPGLPDATIASPFVVGYLDRPLSYDTLGRLSRVDTDALRAGWIDQDGKSEEAADAALARLAAIQSSGTIPYGVWTGGYASNGTVKTEAEVRHGVQGYQ